MERHKSLTGLRMETVRYVRENPNIPDEFKDFSTEVVIDAFNIISKNLGAVELAFRRTRDHPDIKTKAEKDKLKQNSSQ